MSQTQKSHIFYQPFTFALLLCIFAFLSHVALGISDHYLTHTFSILALGLLLFTLKKHSNTLFLITLTFIFIIALGYTPSGLLYGPASIGIIASVYETNFSETLGFFRAMPLSIYFFTFFYLLLFLILLLNISGKITVAFEEEVETVNEFELLEIPAGVEHVITCLQDAQIFVVKL